MFSSLEILDTQTEEEAVSVVRQGAFQPKARPRVRKGAGAHPPTPANTVHSAPRVDAAERIQGQVPDAGVKENGQELPGDAAVPSGSTKREDEHLQKNAASIKVFTEKSSKHPSSLYGGNGETCKTSKRDCQQSGVQEEDENDDQSFFQDATEGSCSEALISHNKLTDALESSIWESEKTDFYSETQHANDGTLKTSAEGGVGSSSIIKEVQNSDVLTVDANNVEELPTESIPPDDDMQVMHQGMPKDLEDATTSIEEPRDGSRRTGYAEMKKLSIRRSKSQQPDASNVLVGSDNGESMKHQGQLKKGKKAKQQEDYTSLKEVLNDTSPLHGNTQEQDPGISESVEPKRRTGRHRTPSVRLAEITQNTISNATNETSKQAAEPRRRRLATFSAATLPDSEPVITDATFVPTTQVQPESTEGQPAAIDGENKKKRLRKVITGKRKVQRRAVNIADPDLDPKKMTMKDIIRLAEAKDRMMKKDSARSASTQKASVNATEPEHEENGGASFAPQVQVIDGRIVINQESLTVAARPRDNLQNYKRVEETHSKLNYHSYMKRTPRTVWNKDETELFYKALQEFGTNFAIIQNLFPGKSRKQVLLKFKKEEKCRPLRVAEAMTLKTNDYSNYMEIINRMNLLPEKEPDAMTPDHQGSPVTLETSNRFMESACLSTQDKEKSRSDEPQSKTENKEESADHGEPAKVSIDDHSMAQADVLKESPKTEPLPPAPPHSLFSYQNFGSKSSKSLFSYQLV